MVGYPQADRAAPLVLQAPRRLARCLEQERVRTGRVGAQQPVLPVVHQGVAADVRQIAAHQGKMMMAIGVANGADSLQRRLVADVAAERIAGIGGIDDHPAAAQSIDRLANEASLRRYRMQLQINTHDSWGYDTRMKPFLDWSPLVVFFVVFELFGIYWATASLMITCTLVLLAHRWSTGSFKTMHLVTVAVVLVLGAATLLLHDKRFIQWKPTVLLALTAVAFLGSMVIGRQPLARRLLEGVFKEPLDISARAWLIINLLWVGWFALLAAANIYVARNFAESVWVNFKVFGISAAMLLFMIPQVLWLNSKVQTRRTGAAPP